MTDRIKALTVVLEEGYKEDAAQRIIDAVALIQGVISVEKHVGGIDHYAAKMQAKNEIKEQFMEFYKEL